MWHTSALACMRVAHGVGLLTGAVQGAARSEWESHTAAGRHAQLQAAQEPGGTRTPRAARLARMLLIKVTLSRHATKHRALTPLLFRNQGSATAFVRTGGSPEATSSGLAYEMTRWR